MSINMAVAASGAAAAAVESAVPGLVSDHFASRLFAEDATLWGPEAESEAGKRLAWTGLHRTSRPLVGEVEALREELMTDGVDRVVLCGMGGSSLAPEVICATEGKDIVILDSSHPVSVRAALTDLDRTVVVVSSKSGGTVETDSQRRAFVAAFEDAGIDPTSRMVIVTDPGSPLEEQSRADGFRVVTADPKVGGRFSALTAFGLVPAALAGVDVAALLDDAEAVADILASDDADNPALILGAVLAGTAPLRDKIMLVENGTPIVGFGDWAEQLVAESTGKNGTGVLPVVVIPDAGTRRGDILDADDITTIELVEDVEEAELAGASAAAVSGALGAQLLLWEAATAVAGCSASTRSTSRTSRARRRLPASCSARAPGVPPLPCSPTETSRSGSCPRTGPAASGSGRRRTCPTPSQPYSSSSTIRMATSPSWRTSTARRAAPAATPLFPPSLPCSVAPLTAQ